MINGFYDAIGGMVTQMNRLDKISNNIANANTNGYKREDVVIGDFMRLYQEKRDELPLDNQTKEAAKFVSRSLNRVPQIVESYTNHEAGGFKETDNTLDFALKQDNRFFGILTPDGVKYTRDGAFNLNEDGYLVNKDGYFVIPQDYFQSKQLIQIPESQRITFDQNGGIYAGDPDTYDNYAQLSSIGVFGFENLDYMKKIGGNLYDATRPEDRIDYADSGSVLNGFIEKSNINMVSEMTALIETNRLVEYYSKVAQTHEDDLAQGAINKLGTIKG